MIDFFANKEPNKVAIFSDKITKTYNQLEKDIRKIERIFKPGQIVIILCKNSYYSLLFYLTCLKVGSIPLLLSDNLNPFQIKDYIIRYKPAYILSPKKINIEEEISEEYGDYCIYSRNQDNIVNNKSLSLLLTTSGSTGNPKVVKVTKDNLLENTKSISEYLNLSKEDRHITTLPMNYTYGLSCINTFLYSGGSIILNEFAINMREFWINIEEYKPTYLAGVPYTYEVLSKYFLEKLRDSSLKVFTQAGGKLGINFIKKFLEFALESDKKFIVMYGQTEATARMSYLPFDKLKEKIGSIGIAIPGGKFSLRNTYIDQNIKGKLIGELVYSGKNVTDGYANSFDELKENLMNCNILNTGDLAWIDEEDFVYLVGRINRFAKISGIRVSLSDIEEMINNLGFTSAILSDDKNLKIYIEGDNEEKRKLINLKKNIASSINISPNSIKLEVIEKLPRFDSGKINYKLIET